MKVNEYVSGHVSESIYHGYVNDYENVHDFHLNHYVLQYQSLCSLYYYFDC